MIPSASPLPRVSLSAAQAARLTEQPRSDTNAGKRDRAILETLYGMGLRRGECMRLDVADLDLSAGTLLVRDGKGHKDRLLPVPGRATAALDAYVKDVRPELVVDPREGALFLTAWWGKRLSEVSLSFLLRRHAQAAGISRVHPHALRHACATSRPSSDTRSWRPPASTRGWWPRTCAGSSCAPTRGRRPPGAKRGVRIGASWQRRRRASAIHT